MILSEDPFDSTDKKYRICTFVVESLQFSSLTHLTDKSYCRLNQPSAILLSEPLKDQTIHYWRGADGPFVVRGCRSMRGYSFLSFLFLEHFSSSLNREQEEQRFSDRTHACIPKLLSSV